MFNSASSRNIRILSELDIRFSVPEGQTSDDGRFVYFATRTASKKYEFVDMDIASAKAAAAARVAKYTRPSSVPDLAHGLRYLQIPCLMSEIYVEKDSGEGYKVVVDVRESDTRLTDMPFDDPVSLFSDLEGRDYDESIGDMKLEIKSVTETELEDMKKQISVTIRSGLDSEEIVTVQYKGTESQSNWSVLFARSIPPGSSVESVTVADSTEMKFFRAVCGNIESDVYVR